MSQAVRLVPWFAGLLVALYCLARANMHFRAGIAAAGEQDSDRFLLNVTLARQWERRYAAAALFAILSGAMGIAFIVWG